MKKTLFPIVSGIFIIILISFSFSNKYEVNNETYQSGFEDNIKVFAVEIPHNIKFADEKVPLNKFYVKEALEREMTVNNIPDDFKYLAVAESGLSQIVSPAGATGIWQIMKHTGRELGLEINADIDQRYDVELATEAACKYLNKAYEKYGNWTLVAASYNAGTNKISKELERQQQDNYYDMIFGEETGRYVYRILAIKALLEKPEDYGFYLRKKDLYKPYKLKKITVDTAISNIPAFAKSFDLNYKEFKIYNPWIRQAYLANKSRRTYTISIPK